MQNYKGSQIAERTLADLGRLIDDPIHLMETGNNAIKPPAISHAGLDILSASQYPHTLSDGYRPGSTSAYSRHANGAQAQPSHFYGGIVYDATSHRSSTGSSSTSSGNQTYRSNLFPDSAPPLAREAALDNDTNHRRRSKRKVSHVGAPSDDYDLRGTAVALQSHQSPRDNGHEEEKRPRKRARKFTQSLDQEHEAGQDDDGKKQRGRPRVDTQDETAADRRRTQIRLAQRAYRNRKETTINGLKDRVSCLQTALEQMNTAFIALHDNLKDSGALSGRQALVAQLDSVFAEFEAMSQATHVEDDDDDPDSIARTVEQKPQARQSETDGSRSLHNSVSPPAITNGTEIEDVPFSNDAHDIFGYAQTWPNGMPGNVMQFNAQIPETQLSMADVVAMTKTQSRLSPRVERPLSRPSASESRFYTYSFQETTFARRLHRYCLERAFQLLTNPAVDPDYVRQIFRFTFCFADRNSLVARWQTVLQRKAGEALENFNVPFIHIGGAGLHFPRGDASGNTTFPPNMAAPEAAMNMPSFGPVKTTEWPLMETPRAEATTEDLLASLGYGGTWFDSHDVEEYLKTKGIFLDGTSSFVEVDPNNLSLLTATPQSTASTVHSLSRNGSDGSDGSSPHHLRSNFSSMSRSSSSSNSPLVRTPESDYSNQVSLNFIPGHWMSAQPPPDAQTSSHNFWPSFDNDPIQPYLTAMEKDYRTLSPSVQIQTTQGNQVWPWGSDMIPNISEDLMSTHTRTADNSGASFADPSSGMGYNDMPLFPSSHVTNHNHQPTNTTSQQQFQHTASLTSDAESMTTRMNTTLRRLQIINRPVTINIEKFLSRMVEGAACLGRAPGFRKELVDNAVVMSLADDY